MKTKFDIGGMSCASCVKHVEDAVKKVDGVRFCSVNLTSNTMIAEFDCDIASIEKAVKKAGYTAKIHSVEKKEPNSILKRIIVSVCFLVLVMYISMAKMYGSWLPTFLQDGFVNGIVQMVLCVPCLVFNYKYFTRGVSKLIRLKPNMDSLVALGAGSAFISGVVTLFVNRGEGYFYFESSAMIVSLVTVGKYFEARSKKKTGESLEKLFSLAPKEATILERGREKSIPSENILVGNKVLVRQGESFPCDGVVEKGEGYVDESVMTGESMPCEKKQGSFVKAGTILLSGSIVFVAEKTGEETMLSKIIETVENASLLKPKIARLADKVAGVFVPIVLLCAVITFLGWFFAGNTEQGISCAIAVLVVSCPCSLGLATPVAVAVGTGTSAERGILFRSPEAIEKLFKTKVAVFDKTGTVTEGKFEVAKVERGKKVTEEEIIAVASASETESVHPLAKAIREYALAKGYTFQEGKSVSSEFGKGVSSAVDGKRYYVGKGSYIAEKCGIKCPVFSEGTAVYVAEQRRYLGCILLVDKVKSSAKEGIDALKKMGVKTVLLTGDNAVSADSVAQKVGMDEVKSDVLPVEKSLVVQDYKKEGTVLMVGDGINDAPALACADIGVAVSTGSDITIENADIVLMQDNLSCVSEAIVIGKNTVKNIKQNLFWAFFYNAIGIPIASGVLFPLFGWTMKPMLASACMSLSSLFVVGNALRYKYLYGRKKMFGKKKEEGEVFFVEGMMCAHCQKRVEEALLSVGIQAKVDLGQKTVTCPRGCDKELVKNTIKNAGYEVKE